MKRKKKFLLSENYVQAKIYIEKGNTIEATNLLKNIIFANDSTYSTLSFFLILNHNLVSDHKELSFLFKHLLENNKFEREMKNLLIYKKSLFNSNLAGESELLEEIKPLISKEHYKKMKPSTYIINAARGNIVDENDLNEALNKNLIAGAALDVFSKEPAKENVLFNNPKAILTPHIAASTTEASIVVAEMVANQISNFLLKGVKINTV